jgi:hypothetical protein
MDLYRLIIGDGPGVLDGVLLGELCITLLWVLSLRAERWR